ncbi:hypothetical protein DSECCO2_638680 [anaerobic digester metagenome]
MDLVRVDDVRRADRANPLYLDERHAPGHVEVPIGEGRETPDHLPFGCVDHRTGVDDHGVCLVGPGQRTAETFQYLFQPLGVGVVVGTPVTLDVDRSSTQLFQRHGP